MPMLVLNAPSGSTLPAGVCAPVTMTLLNAPSLQLANVTASGLTLHGVDTCNADLNQPVLLSPGLPVTFYVRASIPGPASVSASAANAQAVLGFTVVVGPLAQVVVMPPPQLWVDQCSPPWTVQLQDALGNPFTSPTPIPVSLSAMPVSLPLAADAGCNAMVTDVQVPPGQSTATFFARPSLRGDGTLQAFAGGVQGVVPFTVRQRVTHGECVLASDRVDCPLVHDVFVDNTWLVFQAPTRDREPHEAMVTCSLGTTGIHCERFGSLGEQVRVRYALVDLGPEARVQHLRANGGGSTLLNIPLNGTVDPTQAFVVASAASDNQEIRWKTGDSFNVELESGNVRLHQGQASNLRRVDVQVVQHPALRVQRGELNVTQTSVTVGVPGADPQRGWLMQAVRMAQDVDEECQLGLTGEVQLDQVRFIRRPECQPGAVQEVSWQWVEMPDHIRVTPFLVEVQALSLERTVDTPVLATHAVALAGGMRNGLAGAAAGDAAGARYGDMVVGMAPVTGGFQVARQTAVTPVTVGLMVLEFVP